MSPAPPAPPHAAPTIMAAGAVLWRPAADGAVEVALVHRPRYDDWSLPKGKLDPGESMPVAAVREIAEETGCRAVLGPVLGEVRYTVPQGAKLVRYWAAREAGSAGGFRPDDEVDELRWLRPDAAAGLLTYARDTEVLERFCGLGVPTSALLLVRHARAGSRAQWSGSDADRPLSGSGRDQAARLRALLPLFGPDRVHTAPPLRCRETVSGLAADLGCEPVDEPLLGEEGHQADPMAALARARVLAAQPGVTVVCSQGGVIPAVVGAFAAGAARTVDVHPDDIPSRKGSTWVLTFRDATLVAADYYARPAG